MKKQILLTALFISTFHLLTAQNFTEGIQSDFAFSSGDSPALKIQFDKVSKDNIKDAAKDVFKKYDSKLSEVKGIDDEYIITEFTLKENQKITNGKMKILESDGNADLFVFFKTHESEISEQLTPNEIIHYKKLTEKIAEKAVVYEYNTLIEKQEKEIKDENKKLKNLEKKEDNEHKNIGKYKTTIKNSEQEIEQLKTSLTAQELSISKVMNWYKLKKLKLQEKVSSLLTQKYQILKKRINLYINR